ncbi:MAG: carbon-nitrogen hydrolase family protein [Alphaproteobacteria bacterium]|nr:carbon-nitrogen hydrolase family protein [Alphaproteobacteria bacterium]
MADKLSVACVQLTSTTKIEENVAISSALVREAHAKGAQLITLPEVVNLCQRRSELAVATARFVEQEPALAAYRALADELKVWLLVGSLAIKLPGDARLANRSFLIDSAGAIVATYDKIHMFDVNLANGETFRESRTYRPGDRAVVAPTPWGALGMTVCYDVRFPYLYRSVAHAGARMIAVPSAFTRRTGEAHWHILMRSRAIETGCFVIAPAQCGDHEDGRKSYGHSLVVGPWGDVIADGGEQPGVIVAEIDFAEVDKARSMIPSLTHDRSYPAPVLAGDRLASTDAA